jgi:ligand-binding sensor domain-containing protein
MIKNYFKLFLAILFVTNVTGQSGWLNYNSSNSPLPSNTITSIKIDVNGNKWIGTDKGLCKFDGTNWKIFNTENSNIPGNYINSIALDLNSNIWVSTIKYDLDTTRAISYFDGINWNNVKNVSGMIAIDSYDNKWIIADTGLYKFNGNTWKKFTFKPASNMNMLTSPSNLTIDHNDAVWVAVGGIHGLYRIINDEIKFFDVAEGGGFQLNSIFVDVDNKIWINGRSMSMGKGEGAYLIDQVSNNKNRVYDKSILGSENNGNRWFLDNGISKFDGTKWINYSFLNSKILGYFENENYKCGTPPNPTSNNNGVNFLVIDKSGNKWIATTNGLSCLRGNGESNLCSDNISLVDVKNIAKCNGNSSVLLNSKIKDNSLVYIWKDGDNFTLNSKTNSLEVKYTGFYKLLVHDNICYQTTCTYVNEIKDTILPSVPICMITNQNNHNLVVWENIDNDYVSKYRIYKQNQTTSQYELVHEQSKQYNSQWLDTLSSTITNNDRYKISILDSCGNETPLSDNHSTMLLSSNMGLNGTVNLSWNPYEGFDYPTFEIWRSMDGNNFTKIGSVANNSYAYIDNNPPAIAWYQIRISKQDACNPTKRVLTSVNSNIISKEGKSLGLKNMEYNAISIFPNPSNGSFTLNSTSTMIGKPLNIIDITGRSVYAVVINATTQNVSMENIENGTYFLSIDNKEAIKLIKE